VDKKYGPMIARLVLSLVRFACLEEARRHAIGQLPENLQDMAQTVMQLASDLRDRTSSHLHRPQPDLLEWLTKEKDEWTALYDSLARLLRAIWMRSLMVESSPLDCPVNRSVNYLAAYTQRSLLRARPLYV
jgi:hypothetical protein